MGGVTSAAPHLSEFEVSIRLKLTARGVQKLHKAHLYPFDPVPSERRM